MSLVTIYYAGLAEADKQQLNRIEALLAGLAAVPDTEKSILMTLQDLKTQVEKNTALEESAALLIKGIAAQLEAAKSDPAAVQALADELTASGADLAAAVTANTPAA